MVGKHKYTINKVYTYEILWKSDSTLPDEISTTMTTTY